MEKIKILDCTLRDGGYLTNKHFSDNIIYGIINGLTNAGIDYVEIGFLQNDVQSNENVVFLNSADARKYIPKDRKNTLYTVLADYSRYSVSNLDQYDGQSFDVIRICFFKKERKDVLDSIKEILRKGYKVFVQPVDILGFTDMELLDMINDIKDRKSVV
jgi:4-hydroxy 2-oxovalerate aldolase